MVVRKFMSKLVQSLPSWEVTKYYGRVAWFQLQCLKYRIETSETWFNFMNKFMPARLKSESECEEKESFKDAKKVARKKESTKLEKLCKMKKNDQKEDLSRCDEEHDEIRICTKSNKKKRRDENLDQESKKKNK